VAFKTQLSALQQKNFNAAKSERLKMAWAARCRDWRHGFAEQCVFSLGLRGASAPRAFALSRWRGPVALCSTKYPFCNMCGLSTTGADLSALISFRLVDTDSTR
jgi:hypothetical protein